MTKLTLAFTPRLPAYGFLAVLAVLALAVSLILGTAAGRQALLDKISQAVAAPDFSLSMRGLQLGTVWKLDYLSMSDGQGLWLEMENTSISPSLRALLSARIDLGHAAVERLRLDRLPVSAEAPDQQQADSTLPGILIRSVNVDQVHLGPDFLGQQALLSVNGSLGLDSPRSTTALNIVRLDRPGDRLELHLTHQADSQHLDLQLHLAESQGGLLHDLLDLNATEGITLTASGQGPLNNWPLTLHGRISDVAQIKATAAVTAQQGAHISVQATVQPGQSWTRLTALPERPVILDADMVWDSPRLSLTRLDLRAGADAVTATGDWSVETRSLKADIGLEVADLAWILPAEITSGRTRGQIAARLDQSGLTAETVLTLDGWILRGVPLELATARIHLHHPGTDRPWQVQGDMDLLLPSMPQDLRSWAANATASGTASTLRLDALTVAAPALILDANATFDEAWAMDSRLQFSSASILDNQPVAATLEAAFRTQPLAGPEAVNGSLALRLTETQGLPDIIGHLLGPTIQLTTGFKLADSRLTLPDIKLQSRTTATLAADLDLETQDLQARFTATLPEWRVPNLRLAKNTRIEGSLHGGLSNPDLTLTADSPEIVLADQSLRRVRMAATALSLSVAPEAKLQANARLHDQDISLSIAGKAADSALLVQHGALNLPGTRLRVSGDLDWQSLIFAGEATADSTDLGFVGQVMGLDLAGQGQVTARMDNAAGKQRVAVRAQGQGLRLAGLLAASADLAGEVSLPGPAETLNLDLSLQSVAMGKVTLDRVTGQIRPDRGAMSAVLDMRHDPSETGLTANARIAPDLSRIELWRLQGALLGQPVGLDAPLVLTNAGQETVWSQTAVLFGPTRLQTQGRIRPDSTRITARLHNLETGQLAALAAQLPQARLDAGLEITGTDQSPRILLDVTAQDLVVSAPGLDELPSMNLALRLLCNARALEVAATLTADQAAALNARLDVPVQASLFNVHIPANSPLSGHVRGLIELPLLPRLLKLDDQMLTGSSQSDFSIGGTWTDPSLQGASRVKGARYENFRTGTILENLNLDAVAKGALLELALTGTDGAGGSINGQGVFNLDQLRYATRLDLRQCRILRQDLVQATVNGTLDISGAADSGLLQGNLQLEPVTIQLPRSMPPDLAHIEIQEVNTHGSPPPPSAAGPAYPLRLDLQAVIPGRLTVKGRGLDSEWSGRLRVLGDQINPVVRGEMTLLRGRFDFLDRSFNLTRGNLLLGGENPPNPFLDVLGESQVLDTLIQIHLHGPARGFRLDLLSVPPLPQDELLAMILFGRSMSQVSPLQAVQLAQAAAELTGVYSGPGLLDAVKSRLGLQEVDVSKDEHDNTAVGVGGYLGGKYYIRTQSSVSGRDSTKVEIQLTPRISVETEIGSDSRQGGGINWQRDY